jgi:dTMP kinase
MRQAIVKLVIMGTFLAVEGPKGAGKSTLVTALRQRLAGELAGHVVLTKEPTPGFDLGQETHLLGADLARAIAQDRAQHVASVIQPALNSGKNVVCDRYILSSLVFHSADGVPPQEIWRLNQQFPLPDGNLILTAVAEVISGRRSRRASLTRLETGSDPAAELDMYLQFGQEMQERGVALKIVSHETPEQLEQAIGWIMHSIRYGISA